MSMFSDKASAKPGKADYWPGHVVAESLVDDNTDNARSNAIVNRPRKDSNARRKSNENIEPSKGKRNNLRLSILNFYCIFEFLSINLKLRKCEIKFGKFV